jgi:3-deoxy-7-phosphoheptulonate synthase
VCLPGVSSRLQSPDEFNEEVAMLKMTKPYQLAARASRPDGTIVEMGGVHIGATTPTVIVELGGRESEEQLARAVEMAAGSDICIIHIREPVWDSLRVPSEVELEWADCVRNRSGALIAVEVTSVAQIDLAAKYADLLWVGAYHMQNYVLLRALGRVDKPVLLSRGPTATAEELLLAAEYVLVGGNSSVILCEQGIRTFGDQAPLTFDVGLIPTVKELSHLPIIAAPDYATWWPAHALALARASLAAGADGVIVSCDSDGIKRSIVEPLRELCVCRG